MAAHRDRWDIFCRVVDNYGDVGVAWRLARCLAREHGKRVRLILDDLTVLARLEPGANAALAAQRVDGVDVSLWSEVFREDATPDVADVVVETFGCDTPESYVRAMAERKPMPRWINLEYLSAEEWVEGSHALPSPHPRYAPLTRHFFFPGFTARTGGLLREGDLLARRDAFQGDRAAQAEFWRAIAGAVPPDGALKVSLFGYAGAPYESLLEAMTHHAGPVWVIAPEGAAAAALSAWLRGRVPGSHGSVAAFAVPFLEQGRYDELLWACDLNFVRGEDSFLRAQWAARPLVWQIYPQANGAHLVKLDAFLRLYCAALPQTTVALLRQFWQAWNAGAVERALWTRLAAGLPGLHEHAMRWDEELALQDDLLSRLLRFSSSKL